TAVSWKVRLYETFDRWSLRRADAVVCVSDGQAQKVRGAGVPGAKVQVIRNAIVTDRFAAPSADGRHFLQSFFPRPPQLLVGAMSRLSPEKGIDLLIDAAADVVRHFPEAGFLVFGDGPLHDDLARQVAALGLQERFVLA